MNDRMNILARLRRWRGGAGRYVVASVALAYLSAGVAPCAMAATRAPDEASTVAHEDHAVQAHHGHEAHAAGAQTHDGAPGPADHGNEHCPHCSPGAHGDHAACIVLDDLTNVAASHAKDAPQAVVPLLAPAALTVPPPLASPWPPPPLRAVRGTSVPLNIRHCTFLI